MTRSRNLIALSAALAIGLGAVSVAQAANENDIAGDRGGFKIGPLGQRMGGPRYYGGLGYAYVPGYHRTRHYERNGHWYR